MSQYRVTIDFRGKATVAVEAASVAEAEEKALERWEAGEIVRASDACDVLSVKAREGGAVREPARAARATAAPAVIDVTVEPPSGSRPSPSDPVEVEADVVGATPEAAAGPAENPLRRWWPYLWLFGWLYALWALGQYATSGSGH